MQNKGLTISIYFINLFYIDYLLLVNNLPIIKKKLVHLYFGYLIRILTYVPRLLIPV